MTINRQRGFTLIELLVVIAIIGILSSVVLASLSTARGKGTDAKVKSELSGLRASAEIYYSVNTNFGLVSSDVCTAAFFQEPNSGMLAYITSLQAVTTVACHTIGTAYGVSAVLPGTPGPTKDNWCVDSTGKSIAIDAPLGAGNVICN